MVQVEIMVFSGRPNPQFWLDSAEAAELGVMLARCEPGAVGEAPGLGYGGFVIRSTGRADLPAMLEVFNGIRLDPSRAGGTATLRDDAGIEAWLTAKARERGFGELLESLGR